MTGATERRVGAGFLVALLALAVARFISYHATTRSLEARGQLATKREIVADIAAVMTTLQDAETGQRGYLLTGDESYLQPYNKAHEQVGQKMQQLRRLLNISPQEQPHLDELQNRVDEKFDELASTITA